MKYFLSLRKVQAVTAALLFSVTAALAQQAMVRGTVREGQEVLPGASVFVQGGGEGVISG